MSEKELKELYKKTIEEFNTVGRDASRASAWVDHFYAPGVIFHSTARGDLNFEQAKQLYTEMFTAFGMVLTVKHVIAEGDMGAFIGTWSGTHEGTFMGIPATGEKVKVGMAFMAKNSGGKVMEAWTYQDNLSLMRQLGAIPGPAK